MQLGTDKYRFVQIYTYSFVLKQIHKDTQRLPPKNCKCVQNHKPAPKNTDLLRIDQFHTYKYMLKQMHQDTQNDTD